MSAPNLYDDERREKMMTLAGGAIGGHLASVILGRCRAGANTAPAVYYAAVEKLRDRLGGWGTEDPNVRAILGLLVRNRAEAIDYCEWALAWERLTPEEKDRLRASRREEYRQVYQDGEPPTEKQRAFLRHLGYRGEPRSKRHASELIDSLLKSRAA